MAAEAAAKRTTLREREDDALAKALADSFKEAEGALVGLDLRQHARSKVLRWVMVSANDMQPVKCGPERSINIYEWSKVDGNELDNLRALADMGRCEVVAMPPGMEPAGAPAAPAPKPAKAKEEPK